MYIKQNHAIYRYNLSRVMHKMAEVPNTLQAFRFGRARLFSSVLLASLSSADVVGGQQRVSGHLCHRVLMALTQREIVRFFRRRPTLSAIFCVLISIGICFPRIHSRRMAGSSCPER